MLSKRKIQEIHSESWAWHDVGAISFSFKWDNICVADSLCCLSCMFAVGCIPKQLVPIFNDGPAYFPNLCLWKLTISQKSMTSLSHLSIKPLGLCSTFFLTISNSLKLFSVLFFQVYCLLYWHVHFCSSSDLNLCIKILTWIV